MTISRHWIANGCKLTNQNMGKVAIPGDIQVVYGLTDDYADGIKLILESPSWPSAPPGQPYQNLTEDDLTPFLWGLIQNWDAQQQTFAQGTLDSEAVKQLREDNDRVIREQSARAFEQRRNHLNGAPGEWGGIQASKMGQYSSDLPPWQTVQPLRHTASRAPAPEWQDTVASLWEDEIYSAKEQTLCQPGVAAPGKNMTFSYDHDKGFVRKFK
jgi:hypothetical protein